MTVKVLRSNIVLVHRLGFTLRGLVEKETLSGFQALGLVL